VPSAALIIIFIMVIFLLIFDGGVGTCAMGTMAQMPVHPGLAKLYIFTGQMT